MKSATCRAQSRLLRVLAESEVLSIGASRPVSVDVRVRGFRDASFAR